MRLAAQAPVLVQLPERQFGASAVLQSHLIPSHAGKASYTRFLITEQGSVPCRTRSNLPLHLPAIISAGCRVDISNEAHVRAGSPERLSVLRHAFAAHDAATDRLADTVTSMGDGHVAVSHRASDAVTRLIVDEYQKGSDGHYQLRVVGTDLCRCATTCGRGYICMYMLKAISTMTLPRLLC